MMSASIADPTLGPSLRKQALLTEYAEGRISLSAMSEELAKVRPARERMGFVQVSMVVVLGILGALALPFVTQHRD